MGVRTLERAGGSVSCRRPAILHLRLWRTTLSARRMQELGPKAPQPQFIAQNVSMAVLLPNPENMSSLCHTVGPNDPLLHRPGPFSVRSGHWDLPTHSWWHAGFSSIIYSASGSSFSDSCPRSHCDDRVQAGDGLGPLLSASTSLPRFLCCERLHPAFFTHMCRGMLSMFYFLRNPSSFDRGCLILLKCSAESGKCVSFK